MSHQTFGIGGIFDFALPAALQAATKGLAGIPYLAAIKETGSSGRKALASFGWDASSLIECRVMITSHKGFFARSLSGGFEETSALRREQ